MRFFPGKFHLYKGASTFVILQAQFLLLRRNAERIFATETRRHGERVSPTVLCGHRKKGHCSKLAEKNLVKLSLRAQRSNLVNGKGLLRRCAPRNDRLKGSLSVKLLQSQKKLFLTPKMGGGKLDPKKKLLIKKSRPLRGMESPDNRFNQLMTPTGWLALSLNCQAAARRAGLWNRFSQFLLCGLGWPLSPR